MATRAYYLGRPKSKHKAPKRWPPRLSLGVVILAAGRSTRMGRPKLLLPWGGSSVLGHLIRQWRSLGARQIAVICAAGDQAIQGELDRLEFSNESRVINPAPDRGMFSSIQCAAQWPGWKTALTHWAVVLGDQPHLRDETLRRAIEFARKHPRSVCQPMRAGHRLHPVFLPKREFERLADSAAADLKEFLSLARHAATFRPPDDPGLELDIDRPQDYQKALVLADQQVT